MVLLQSSFVILSHTWQFITVFSIQGPLHSNCWRIKLTVAWLNLSMPKQTVKNGLKSKKIKLPQINFFSKNNGWNCHVPISPFHYAKFKKNSWDWSKVMRMRHFWAQNGPFVMNKFFWYKPVLLPSSTYWPFSLCWI